MIEGLFGTLADSLILVLVFLGFLIIGFILFILSKIPPLRWLALSLATLVKYALLIVFNTLAIGLIVGMGAFGVDLLLALFQYMDWEFFMVGQEILIVHHDPFFITAILISLCLIGGIFLGTFILSFIPLSSRKYIIISYMIGVVVLFLALPKTMQLYASGVDVSVLGMIVICAFLPVLALVFAIASGQKRHEKRKIMTYKEGKQADREEKRRTDFNKRAIFPWIKARAINQNT